MWLGILEDELTGWLPYFYNHIIIKGKKWLYELQIWMQRNKIKQQHKNRLLSKANYILLRRLLHCWNGSLNLVTMDFMWAHLHFAQNLSSVTQKASTPKYLAMGNKANLRDLIAATGLVILLKFDPNHRFFSPCDLEIWCMTSKNNRAPLLYYIKLCVSFQIHRWIQTEVTLRKSSIRVEIGDFLSLVTLKFDGWPWKMIGHLFCTTSSFVHHFESIGEFKLELQSRNAQFGSKSAIFCPVWPWNLMNALEKQ